MSRITTVRAVIALQSGRHTVLQLAAASKVGKTSAEVLIRDLLHAGFVEFVGWGERPGKRGQAPAVYGWKAAPAGWANGPGVNGGVGGCDVELVGFEIAAP